MTIPTRLANDGWWLCESLPTAPDRNFSFPTDIDIQWRSRPETLIERISPIDMTELARALETPAEAATPESVKAPRNGGIFGADRILHSLVLFNLLFAVQSNLDVIYLWGNTSLPPDVSYASYAHRGAFPLIVAALLAGGFILAALRLGGPAERSWLIRPLVYLWVAQNALLVLSSVLRLDLYVQNYLLTWWRLAAFIWMGLVAQGLLLIVARIAMRRSNDWLIGANLITLAATLYVFSLVNFVAIIAAYNVSHSPEANSKGGWINVNYLFTLGPQALPAIDRVIALRGFDPSLVSRLGCLVERQVTDGFLAFPGLSELSPRARPERPAEKYVRSLVRPPPFAPGETFDTPHSDR